MTDRISARAPDHVKNPNAYTQYSLEGVSHSKAQNTTAAFDLINQLKERREGTSSTKAPQSTANLAKPTFNKKPTSKDTADTTITEGNASASIRSMAGGTRVMEECVVGKKKVGANSANKAEPKIVAKVNNKKLSMFDDEDSDEEMS